MANISIAKNDVFFSWLEFTKVEQNVKKLKFVTMSFPKYSWLKDKVKEDDELKEKMAEDVKAGNSEIPKDLKSFEYYKFNPLPYVDKNEILVSNWEFHLIEENWKIDEISIINLRKHIDSMSYARWISRVKLTIGTRANFIAAIRYDYGTDRLFAFIVIWIVLLSPILGAIKLF